jgi:probable rRNA maturation factor
MTRAVDVATDRVRVPLARSAVADIVRAVLRAERVPHALVSVTFVSDQRIAALNRAHLRRSGATDVIAFGFAQRRAADPVIGDVYIAPGVARNNAAAHGVSMREEIARLVVHGVLHVLGFDHPDGPERTASAMWRRQEQLLRRFATTRDRKPRKRPARAA